ncbi:MAG: hypothetical protein CFE36_04555 [Sphingomonadaceae bacterium PASS1]|jgi:hypothetical protein|nr:MAG: hypothetical protein CFE36_04555 [Sphingomonadaceae bacterium PASS1]
MKFAVLIASGALLCAVPAQAMDAETFYVKALALKKKGMGAVFSKEIKPMARLFQAAADSVKTENEQARASGKPLFCAPKKYRLTAAQFLEEFASIPQERRRIQTVRDAWREIVMRRFPC